MYRIYADNLCIFDDAAPEILNTATEPWSVDANLSAYEGKLVYITSSAKWSTVSSSSAIRSKFVPIPDGAESLTLENSVTAFYTLLTDDTYTNNGTPSYATGYSNRTTYSGTKTVTIPADAKYVWLYTHTTSADTTPSKVTFSGENQYTVRGTGMVSPKLTLTAGAAGSLSFVLPPECAGYSEVKQLTTTIRVTRDGNTIWMGRVLTEQADIWHCRQLFCEGALAWLNDTVVPTATITGTATNLLTAILGAYDGSDAGTYNAKVSATRRISVGTCNVTGADLTLSPDYGTALETVNKLISGYGGILRMRYVNGVPTLDWLADYPPVTGYEQPLVFGENLLDFTRNWDLTNYATVCYVRGGEIPNTDPAQTAFGSYTLQSAVTLYGTIEKFLSLTDLTSNQECAAAAEHFLRYEQFDGMALEVTALDLHILNPTVTSYDVMQRVPVRAPLYGLNESFAVTAMDIPLDVPESTKYTLGPVNVAYVRRVKTITKVTEQNQQAAQDYTDAAAAVLEAADDKINARVDSAEGDIATLEITQGQIESRVESAEGDISAVTQTASEIKAAVYDNAQGKYTVMTIDANNGVTIGNGTSATNIDGGFLNAATIQAGIIRGATISVIDGSGNAAGNFYTDGSIGQIGISALMVDFARDYDVVYFASPANIIFADTGKTLAQLLSGT